MLPTSCGVQWMCSRPYMPAIAAPDAHQCLPHTIGAQSRPPAYASHTLLAHEAARRCLPHAIGARSRPFAAVGQQSRSESFHRCQPSLTPKRLIPESRTRPSPATVAPVPSDQSQPSDTTTRGTRRRLSNSPLLSSLLASFLALLTLPLHSPRSPRTRPTGSVLASSRPPHEPATSG